MNRALSVSLLFCAALSAQTTLVPAGAVWRYLDNGSDQGSAWQSSGFNDGSWLSGPAQLGYGDGDEATVVGFGPNSSAKYPTTYFRHSFSVSNPGAFLGLTLNVKRDDGVVVYLNGTEVYRSNMPAGTPTYLTYAAAVASDDGATWQTASISPGALVAGTNVIAAEIHQSNATSSDISFGLELIGSSAVSVTRGPYLQLGTPNQTTIRWRTNAATDSRVRFGISPATLSSSVTDGVSTTEHVVTLQGLAADTRYYYAVGSTTADLAGGDTEHSFVTAPPVGGSRATRIWVVGDSGTADANARAVRDAYYTFTGTTHTDLWLMLGDNAYNSGTDSEYQAAVYDMYPQMLRKSVLWPTLGNHDTASSSTPPASLPYFQMFTLPTSGQAGGVASGTENYYSFDFGNIHFVCLDSMASSRSAGSPMLTWLENDLAANSKDWLIAYWHHPPYSKGSHDSDTDSIMTQMRANVLPLLESYGVDLVLTGHSHSYERSFLLDGHYGTSSTLTSAMKLDAGSGRPAETGAYVKPRLGPNPHEGAVYAVAGSSGQISGGSLNHPAMFISLNNLGSMVLDVDGARLDAKFLRETGAVADSFTILKGSTVNTPPVVSMTSPANGASYIAPATIQLAANASDADGTIQKVEFYQGAQLLGTSTAAPYTFSWSGVAAGVYVLSARAYDNLGATTDSTPVNVTVNPPVSITTLISKGATWRYLDNGSNQGTAWRKPGFNDASWKTGAAQFGYGEGDETTVVSYGTNARKKYVTTYFRMTFDVPSPGAFSGLTLNVLRDDGAVVYINGSEVWRSNMPSGGITYTTLASSNIAGGNENSYIPVTLSPSTLTAGTNVIAVEIHIATKNSRDMSFNLELIGQ